MGVFKVGLWPCGCHNAAAAMAVSDLHTVLRRTGNKLGSDYISARIGTRALCDPYLKIDFLLPKGEVIGQASIPNNERTKSVMAHANTGDPTGPVESERCRHE
jgi:hypothetical protein